MTNGCFDVLHPGHIRYLRQARALGDRLIVAVNDDASVRRLKGADRPVNALADRMALLAALDGVDWVVPFGEDTPERLIGAVLPDVLVKGGDYTVEQIAGAGCVQAAGGEVRVLPFVTGYSTTSLLDRVRKRGEA
jgi:rfaE bifunctional protein nucleotidyltransferase chain/domain